ARTLNRYRFTIPYLWHVWVRYCPEPQRVDLQRRLADALEVVYEGARDLISPLLVILFEATGQEERASPYRHRTQVMANLEALRWQVTMLETLATRGESDSYDSYRLFALRVALSTQLFQEGRWGEGVVQAERAQILAQTWHDPRREAEALNLLGLNLPVG